MASLKVHEIDGAVSAAPGFAAMPAQAAFEMNHTDGATVAKADAGQNTGGAAAEAAQMVGLPQTPAATERDQLVGGTAAMIVETALMAKMVEHAAAEMGRIGGSEHADVEMLNEGAVLAEIQLVGDAVPTVQRPRCIWLGPPAVVREDLPRLYRGSTSIWLGQCSAEGVKKLKWVTCDAVFP